MNENKNTHRRLTLSIVSLVILILLTLFFLFSKFDIDDILRSFADAQLIYIICGLLMVVCYVACEATSIKIVICALGVKTPFRRALTYAATDAYFSSITPAASGGQPFVTYYMSKDSIPFFKSTLTMLLFTVAYKIVLLLFAVIILVFFPGMVFDNGSAVTVLYILGSLINLFLVSACLACMFSKKLVRIIVKKGIAFLKALRLIKNPERRLAALEATITQYNEAALFLKSNLSVSAKVMSFTLVQRVAMFSVAFFVYRSLGCSSLNYIEILALQSLISLCVDSLPLPGAMAVTEIAFLLIYKKAYPDESLKAAALLITRGISYYFCMIFSGAFALTNHVRLWKTPK